MSFSPQAPQHGKVVAVAEHQAGQLAPVTWELISCGQLLAQMTGREFVLLVLGEEAETLGKEALARCGTKVIACPVPGLDAFHGEAQRALLKQLLPALDAGVILAANTTTGLEWAPSLALAMGACFVSGVEAAEPGPDGPELIRGCQHGKLQERLAPMGEHLVVTVQPGAFPPAEPNQGAGGSLEVMAMELPACRAKVRDLPEHAGGDSNLRRARVVVAGGRGLGKPENLALLRELAALFGDSALAGTRPVCDLGWMSYHSQVGLTGATVAPKLYVACGLSGARQHVVGMMGAELVVAINSDPTAPIFSYCDIGVVEDLTVFIPALLAMAGQ